MRNDFESNYLAHHGILGMKWGNRNGPPYPLGSEDHSAREKKDGYRKSLGKGRNEELYDRKPSKSSKSSTDKKKEFHLTDNQKKAIKIGAAVAATALVAYGGYKLASSPKVRSLIAKGLSGKTKAQRMAELSKQIDNMGPEIVRKTGGQINRNAVIDGVFQKKQNYIHSIDETMKGINPNYYSDKFHILAESDMAPIDTVNCVACCQTYELKARGYEGIAQLIDTRKLNYRDAMRSIYKNADDHYEAYMLKSWGEASEKLARQGAGARGNMVMPFAKGGGHNIVYDVDKTGKPWFIDPQSSNKFDDLGKLADFLVQEHGPNWQLQPKFASLRTDNLEYNDIKMIRKLVAG